MAFTPSEKVDVRRFCGYQAYGAGASGFQSWRFFEHYGLLEYKLTNLAAEEEAVVRTVYLYNLNNLETAILGTSDNLDTKQAAVWTHNENEQDDREKLYTSWRRKLCQFLGVPAGEGLQGGGTMRMVI